MKSTPLKMKFVFKNILFIYNREHNALHITVFILNIPLKNYIVEKLIENKYRVKRRGQSFGLKWQIFILFYHRGKYPNYVNFHFFRLKPSLRANKLFLVATIEKTFYIEIFIKINLSSPENV